VVAAKNIQTNLHLVNESSNQITVTMKNQEIANEILKLFVDSDK